MWSEYLKITLKNVSKEKSSVMVKRCTILGCNPNYHSRRGAEFNKKKVPVFRFPSDKEECDAWLRAIPFKNIVSSKEAVICEQHWTSSYPTMSKKGRIRPWDPPSVWQTSIPPSCIPNPPATRRPTKQASFVIRSTQSDELDEYRKSDQATFSDIKERASNKGLSFGCPTTFCETNGAFLIQSLDMSEGVPRFVLQIEETLHFKAFHMGIAVSVPFIIKNRINLLNSWSAIEETVRYLHTYEESHHVTIIQDQLRAMRPSGGNRKIYSPEDFVRAFSYYALSRSLYQRMREDFKLPSVSTLSNITSSCNKQSISIFLQNVIDRLEDPKKGVCFTSRRSLH